MRIGAFLSYGIGGADKATLNLVRALKRAGTDLVLFYGYNSIPRRIDTHPSGYEPPSRSAQFEEVSHVHYIEDVADIAAHKIDLLHTNRSGSDVKLIPGLQEAKNLPFKILETNFHGDLQTPCDRRIFVSKALAAKHAGSHEVIPNATSQPTSAGNLKAELGLEGKFVFGRLARPDSDLYCPLSFKAYAMMQNDRTAFLYVGPCPQARADAASMKLKNVLFLEPILDDERISKLYNTMDVHTHSNNVGETFGNTIAESMIHGIPTISHRGFMDSWPQAHQEHFEDTPPFYVADRNPDRYAYFMNLLMTNEQQYFAAARAQKYRANRFYDADVVASQYLKIYEEMAR